MSDTVEHNNDNNRFGLQTASQAIADNTDY